MVLSSERCHEGSGHAERLLNPRPASQNVVQSLYRAYETRTKRRKVMIIFRFLDLPPDIRKMLYVEVLISVFGTERMVLVTPTSGSKSQNSVLAILFHRATL